MVKLLIDGKTTNSITYRHHTILKNVAVMKEIDFSDNFRFILQICVHCDKVWRKKKTTWWGRSCWETANWAEFVGDDVGYGQEWRRTSCSWWPVRPSFAAAKQKIDVDAIGLIKRRETFIPNSVCWGDLKENFVDIETAMRWGARGRGDCWDCITTTIFFKQGLDWVGWDWGHRLWRVWLWFPWNCILSLLTTSRVGGRVDLKVALYGLSYVKVERLHRLFRENKVQLGDLGDIVSRWSLTLQQNTLPSGVIFWCSTETELPPRHTESRSWLQNHPWSLR